MFCFRSDAPAGTIRAMVLHLVSLVKLVITLSKKQNFLRKQLFLHHSVSLSLCLSLSNLLFTAHSLSTHPLIALARKKSLPIFPSVTDRQFHYQSAWQYSHKEKTYFVITSGNDVHVHLHTKRESEIRSHVVTGDTCRDSCWCQVGTEEFKLTDEPTLERLHAQQAEWNQCGCCSHHS